MFLPRPVIAMSLTIAIFTFVSLLIPGASIRAWAQTTSATIPDDTAQGIKLYHQGNTEEAIKILTKVVKNRRDDADAWYYLGLAYNREERIADALLAFQKVVDLRPEFRAAHAHLAYALLLTNQTDRAASEAVYAVGLGEQTAQLHYVIGEAFLRQNEFERALEKADAALELDSKYSSALILKSLALVGLKRPQEAAESLEKFLSLSTLDNNSVWRGQMEALRQLGNKTSSHQTDASAQVFKGKEVVTKAQLATKPEPAYTEKARKVGVEGTVALQTVFSSDGTIQNVIILQWLPYGLTERAVEAARKIKFTPAIKDGRPVSMYYRIEYNFNLY